MRALAADLMSTAEAREVCDESSSDMRMPSPSCYRVAAAGVDELMLLLWCSDRG